MGNDTDVDVDVDVDKQLRNQLKAMGDKWSAVETAVKDVAAIKTANDAVDAQIKALQAEVTSLRNYQVKPAVHNVKSSGKVSDDCARWISASCLVSRASNQGSSVGESALKWAVKTIQQLSANTEDYEVGVRGWAKEVKDFGAQTRASVTVTEIQFPITYSTEVFSLVVQYGTFRANARVIPVGKGSFTMQKLNASPGFGAIGAGASVPEKQPSVTQVTSDPKKWGGIIRYHYEVEDQAYINFGNFLADYIAREIAAIEDLAGWKGDGSGTYNSFTGVVSRVVTNSKTTVMATTNTSSDKVTVANMRAIRGVPNQAVYNKSNLKYYSNPTMEAIFNSMVEATTATKPYDPQRQTFDGFPIVWVPSLPVNSPTAIVNTIVVLFGCMDYTLLTTRGSIRMDYSKDAYWTTDESAIRVLTEFGLAEVDTTAMAGIRTAAS